MRFFQSILLVGLAAAVGYLWFFRKPETGAVENFIFQQSGSETPIRRLSAFVDAHYDRIFAPLTAGDTVMSAQELRQIQATLRDLLAKSSSEKEKKVYAKGASLSALLLQAIAEREKHARRLSDSRTKGYEAVLARREDREKESRQKQEFFEGGIHRSWEAASQRISVEVGREYDYLRLLER